MDISRLLSIGRIGVAALIAAGLAGCGGGDGGGSAGAPASTAIATAASANPAGTNTADNPKQAFSLVQGAGLTPVTVNSPPVVNFTVINKSGQIVKGLTTSNISFALAKLVPGVDGNPDQWWSYIYRTETATAGVGPGGAPALASAKQATTDPKAATQLTFNDAGGYYTYTFSTDIKDPTKTNGVTYEPGKVHRIAIQLSYTDSDGSTVRVNPYFDFTIDANGKSVAVTDPTKTRVMADVSNCNTCHNELALHGGGRVDVQYCVMCHNPGTVDANSGNVLELKTMVHKIHSGRRLHADGEDYTIWGYQNSKHEYAEVGFPQDLRNCTKCHNASAATPQGDNWKSKPSKQACLTCHTSGTGSNWYNLHVTTLKLGTSAATIDNNCTSCHGAGKTWSAEQVHWNQNEENAAKYKVVIDSASFNSTTRNVTVKYHVDDTTNGNAKWALSDARFANLRFVAAYGNIPGQSTSVTEFTSYNNNGSGVNKYLKDGTNDGNNVYTVDIAIPADIAGITQAQGTGRVFSYGQVVEQQLNVVTRTPVSPAVNINVSALNTHKDFAISGALNPRRDVVANEKCNACHGLLGTASGSNELNNAFHGGARNTIESCAAGCHDPLRAGQYTVMNNDFKFPASVLGGAATTNNMNESHHLKRMIHGIHGGARKQYPFLHGTRVGGAVPENITAEVAYPGVLSDCNTCHVNNSYQTDRGVVGSALLSWSSTATGSSANENVALRPLLLTKVNGTDYVDALKNPVISPKAASCTACHDTVGVISHVTTVGGATFGGKTQGQFLNNEVFEACEGCHAPGGFVGVDTVHKIKTQNVN